MPNWCYNTAKFHHDDVAKIDALEAELRKEDSQMLNHLRPNPAGEWDYGWSVENWGTKWDVSPMDFERESDNRIIVHFDSAWSPPVMLYQFLESEGWSVYALYHEPGMGFAGKFEDGYDQYYEYDYTDRDEVENLPEDIQDFTNALDNLENWEAEQEQEEYDELIESLDKTEWFPKKVKPVHVGQYQVKTKNWPYPNMCQWTGDKWQRWEGDDIKVTEWRGLVKEYKEWDEVAELEKILAPLEAKLT